MIGYIRNPRTFEAVQIVTVTSYELPLETAQGETGKVTIVGRLDADYSRYLFHTENHAQVYKITGQQNGDNQYVTLTVADSISVLEGYTVGLKNAIMSDNLTYRMIGTARQTGVYEVGLFGVWENNSLHSFIQFNNYAPTDILLDQTNRADVEAWLANAFIPTESISDGAFNNYTLLNGEKTLRAMRNNGCAIDLLRNGNVMNIVATPQNWQRVTIPFADGHSELLSESYNNDICSHVIVHGGADSANTGYVYDVYLESGGSAGVYFGDQIQGYTSIAEYDSSAAGATYFDKCKTIAEEIFAKNTYSHKIEFASDREMRIGQPVRLILNRGILDTTISKVMLKSGDNRYYYTCGELPVTAAERIKADSWTYGDRLPSNPFKGQLFLEV